MYFHHTVKSGVMLIQAKVWEIPPAGLTPSYQNGALWFYLCKNGYIHVTYVLIRYYFHIFCNIVISYLWWLLPTFVQAEQIAANVLKL